MVFKAARRFALVALLLPAAEVDSQSVLLQMRPRVGDTLYLRLEQQIEMRGVPHAGLDAGPVTNATMRVRARAIPTEVTGGIATLLTITDSVSVSPADAIPMLERARRALAGRRAQVRVLPDGSMELVDPTQHVDESSLILGNMPAVLPPAPVRRGDTWVRQMKLPIRATRVREVSVRATFRLDSLSRDSQMAYVSIRGGFYETPSGSDSVAQRQLQGSLVGAIEFDRRLGWITSSNTTVTLRSQVRMPPPRATPMEVWMRVTQRLTAKTTP
jgi:hypothetical protein